ncbi:hypothetical protein EVG20_g10256 [Dentipellis fragilis]|uniref:Uncharacterized protein n=1 Tax=Dentipellis fragilis TaxID=205917 RepID=A0A4Y9XTM1_9AGAM|nr:hypothetical protein EVG20_g10256 [Dentipellis fragilis]
MAAVSNPFSRSAGDCPERTQLSRGEQPGLRTDHEARPSGSATLYTDPGLSAIKAVAMTGEWQACFPPRKQHCNPDQHQDLAKSAHRSALS